MGRLRILSGCEVYRILKSQGLAEVRCRGSHVVMQRRTARHAATDRRLDDHVWEPLWRCAVHVAVLLAVVGLVAAGCTSPAPIGEAPGEAPALPVSMHVQVEGDGAALGVPCPIRVRIRNDSSDRTLEVPLPPPQFAVHFEPVSDPVVVQKRTGGPLWAPDFIIPKVVLGPGEVKELRTYLDYDLRLKAPGEARIKCTVRLGLETHAGSVSGEFVLRVARVDEQDRERRLRPYLEALDSGDEGARAETAGVLSSIAGAGDRGLAEKLVAHRFPDVRVRGVYALDSIGEDWAIARIRELVHDPDPDVAIAGLETLCARRKVLLSEEDLLRLLVRPEEGLRIWLVDYLDMTRHPLRGEFLARLLEDPAVGVRLQARAALSVEDDR